MLQYIILHIFEKGYIKYCKIYNIPKINRQIYINKVKIIIVRKLLLNLEIMSNIIKDVVIYIHINKLEGSYCNVTTKKCT